MLKVTTLSGEKSDIQELKILPHILMWIDKCVELEADLRHVVRETGLEEAVPSKIQGVKSEGDVENKLPVKAKKRAPKEAKEDSSVTR